MATKMDHKTAYRLLCTHLLPHILRRSLLYISYSVDTITVWWWCCFSYYSFFSFYFFPVVAAVAAAVAPLSLIYHRVSNILCWHSHSQHNTAPGTRTIRSAHSHTYTHFDCRTLCCIISPAFFSLSPFLSFHFALGSILFIIASVCSLFCSFDGSFVSFFFSRVVAVLLRTTICPRNEWNNTICIHICFLWVATHDEVCLVPYWFIRQPALVLAFCLYGVANGTLYFTQ